MLDQSEVVYDIIWDGLQHRAAKEAEESPDGRQRDSRSQSVAVLGTCTMANQVKSGAADQASQSFADIVTNSCFLHEHSCMRWGYKGSSTLLTHLHSTRH